MTARLLLLTVSLLANAALAALYLSLPPAPAATSPANPGPGALAAPSPAAESAAPSPAGAPPAPAAFSWAAIDTPDLDELTRRLKAAGFTAGEIRIVLAQRIERLAHAGQPDAPKPTPYWRTAAGTPGDPRQVNQARQQLMLEQQKLLQKHVLNPESLADDPDRIEDARRTWGDLPVEKLQAIAAIEADYQQMNLNQSMAQSLRPGAPAEAMNSRLLLEKERLADIAAILTPEEFATYELRASRTAGALRFQLQHFKPTEEEFKALFTIRKAYEDRLADGRLDSETRRHLNQEINRQVEAVLGADRAKDYDAVVNQNSHDETARLVSRLGLPARVAVEVRQTQQDFTQRARDLRADASLTPADRAARIDALAREAATQLTARLGADGFEAYSDLKGEWLRNLGTR